MARSSTVKLDMAGFELLKKQLEDGKGLTVKVGILPNTAARSNPSKGPDLNNAEVGLKQEFGSASEGVPVRSFLRMPLNTQLPKKMQQIGQAAWVGLIKEDGVEFALEELGKLAVGVVQQGFDTRGFGQWAPNAPYTIRKKGSSMPLIDTRQLRRSITSEVAKAGANP